MMTPKFPNSEAFTPDFLSSKEGEVMDNETYVNILRNDTLRSPEEGSALAEAALYATPIDHDPLSSARAQIASASPESSIDTLPPYVELSDQELSARLQKIFRKDKINGTRTDFDLAA